MAKAIGKLLAGMRNIPGSTRFAGAVKVGRHFFGEPRTSGSHHIFRTPWPGDPRVNLQDAGGGKAKTYQVRQMIPAIERLGLIKTAPDEGAGDR